MPVRIPISRRSFIQTTGTAAAATWAANSYGAVVGANEKIRVGFIGAGGMANAHMDTINAIRQSNNVEPVAVADCWKTRAEQGAAKLKTNNVQTDYRKILDMKEVDYVTIATPEHRTAR